MISHTSPKLGSLLGIWKPSKEPGEVVVGVCGIVLMSLVFWVVVVF